MISSIADIPNRRGRKPSGGRKAGIMLRLDPDMLAALDALIAESPDPKPTRPEAVRQVLATALNRGGLK